MTPHPTDLRGAAWRVVVTAVVLTAAACGGRSPVADTPADALSPLPLSVQPIRIVDGIDGRGLSFASVNIESIELTADSSGWVYLDPAHTPYAYGPPGAAIDVEVPGYLPRRTVVPADRRITLWPVAGGEDGEEAAAVRAMVYGAAAGPRRPQAYKTILLSVQSSQDLRDAWMEEASAFGRSLGLEYDGYPWDDASDNVLRVTVDPEPRGCVSDASPAYCRASTDGRTFSVAAGRARDARTIRRVLAAWFLRPNPMPGLLNDEQPADTLSPLEARTIRMLLQRPRPNQWPDSDR